MATPQFTRLAAAFVRGRKRQGEAISLSAKMTETPLEDLSDEQLAEVVAAGRQAGLRLHKFKRTMELARVRRTFGVLHSVHPSDLLDVGSGRGTFLWPLIDEFPQLKVTAIDENERRASDLKAVQLGGVDQLDAHRMDVCQLAFADDAFHTVTMLEVLEHIPDTGGAVSELVRVAREFIVLTVPSKPDDNPEHIHVFTQTSISERFAEFGITRISFDYVLGHMLAAG